MSFDFSNVFPTLTHNFITAVLRLIELPECMISFILSTLTAPYHFCVGRGVVRRWCFTRLRALARVTPSPLYSFPSVFPLYYLGLTLSCMYKHICMQTTLEL